MIVKLKTLADVRRIELPCHARDDGDLVVIEQGNAIPFPVLRMFTVRATEGAVRGQHAHRACTQFLVCVHGSIQVDCDDGSSMATFQLDRASTGLLVPASIWASEKYVTSGSILAVLCDRHYEADDYIRDYEEFLAWRKG